VRGWKPTGFNKADQDSAVKSSALAEVLEPRLLQSGIEVRILDTELGPAGAISSALADQSDLDAVHLFAHGASGEIHLGGASLDATSLQQNAGEVASWGDAFSASGDFLIYGCDVAAGATGQAFTDQLSLLTGTDVAASKDVTGHSSLGGDWELEYVVGHRGLNATGDLDVSSSLTLRGVEGGTSTITTTAGFRFMEIQAGSAETISVTLEHLVLVETSPESRSGGILAISENADLVASNVQFLGATGPENGGAISNRGTLVLTDSRFDGNSATQQGGAIWNAGTSQLTNVEFSNNSADRAGGAVFNDTSGVMSGSGWLFDSNQAGEGAGLFSQGAVSNGEEVTAP